MNTFCLDSNEAVGIKKIEIDKRSFLKLSFTNDGINLDNILHHKSVKSKIPPYLKDQTVDDRYSKIGINCVPLLAILLRHAYETYFFQGLLKNKNSAKL
jgi:hypothetical protein